MRHHINSFAELTNRDDAGKEGKVPQNGLVLYLTIFTRYTLKLTPRKNWEVFKTSFLTHARNYLEDALNLLVKDEGRCRELGNNLLKTEIMPKLSTRESYLRRVGKKRRAMIKGKEYHFSNKKPSSKFRKIVENNYLIIKQLSRES